MIKKKKMIDVIRFKKDFKINITFFIIIALFWAMIIFVMRPFNSGDKQVTGSEIGTGEILSVIDPISSDMIVEQEFKALQDNMCEVSLCFDTFGEKRYGKVLFTLLSESGKIITEEKVDMSELGDKSFYKISFDDVEGSKGRTFIVRLTSTVNDPTKGVSVWYRAKDLGSRSATVNGDELGGTLRIKVGYLDNGLQILQITCWLIVIILSFVFALTITSSYEKNFIRLAFLLGILVLFINPFPHVIDESTHFFRSYMISQGDFYDTTFVGRIGGNVPVNFSEYLDNGKLSIKSFYQNPDKWLKTFDSEKEFYIHPYMSSAIPVNHTFAAVILLFCRLLGLPVLFAVLSGRLITYLIYVTLCYFAIKKAKYYKGMFFVISCLPVSVWLAGSFSIDPMVLSASLLYTSICLRHFLDKGNQYKLTMKEKSAMVLTAVMFISVKYLIYSPILLMMLLIPKDKYSKKGGLILSAVITLLFVGFLVWQVYLLKRFPFVEDRNGDVNVSRQISYVFSHIPGTVRVFLDYISENMFPHIEGFSNSRGLSFITSFIGIITVFGSALEPDRYPFTEKKDKMKLTVICIIIFVICSLLIMASLYVGFTPVGSDGIEGLQTRYFLPVLIFAMLPISMVRVTNSIKQYREKITLLMGIGIMDMLAELCRSYIH